MKRILFLGILVVAAVMLSACSDDGVRTESTIIVKEVIEGDFYFRVTYNLEGFEDNLEAHIKVTEVQYNQYDVGDTFIFTRPSTDNYRRS